MTHAGMAGESEDPVQNQLLRLAREAAETRTRLPGEPELATRLGCTRQQLRNALAGLERRGIVRRRQGAMTTVDPIALRLSVRLEEQLTHTALLRRLGYHVDVDTLTDARHTIAPHVAALLELPADTGVSVNRRRWRADGRVAILADTTVPLPDGARVDPDEPTFEAVARLHGEPIVWEATTLGVAVLDEDRAAQFERPVGTPVMTLEFIGVGASGRRLLHSLQHHDPEIASYSVVRTARPPWA